MVVTIDGPAASGKSTAARELAKALGIAFLDSGATYRAVTLKALRAGVDMTDQAALARIAAEADLALIPDPRGVRVMLDGRDVSDAIRSAEVSNESHHVAGAPAVREVLVALQRRIAAGLGDFVAEGRDQGSVVFPHADVKFYLDASPEVRARRRQEETAAAGREADFQETLRDILRRDRRDSSRPVAPLIKPDDAVVIDTSRLTIDQVVAEMLGRVEAAR